MRTTIPMQKSAQTLSLACRAGAAPKKQPASSFGLHSVGIHAFHSFLLTPPVGFWLASFVLLIIDWRSGNLTQRPRDPPFTRPDIEEVEEEEEEEEEERRPYRPVGSAAPPPITTTSSAIPPVAARRPTYDNSHVASPFADTNRLSAVSSAPTTVTTASTAYLSTAQRNSGYSGYATPPAATSRPSLDAYGAFSDPAPTGFGGVSNSYAPSAPSEASGPRISRTMQYADPYAAVRASLAPSGSSGAPPSYTSYTGY